MFEKTNWGARKNYKREREDIKEKFIQYEREKERSGEKFISSKRKKDQKKYLVRER